MKESNFLLSTTTVFVVSILNFICAFALRLVLGRSLTLSEFGLFYALFSFLTLSYILRDMGFNQSLIKHIPQYAAKGENKSIRTAITSILSVELALSTIITITIWLLAPWLAMNYFGVPEATNLIRLFSAAFFLLALDYIVPTIILGFQRTNVYALLLFVRSAGLLAFTVLFLSLGMNVSAPVVSYFFVSAIIIIVGSTYIVRKIFPIHSVRAPLFNKNSRSLLLYGFAVFTASIGGTLLQNIDATMITAFRGVGETGLYTVSISLSAVLLYFSASLVTVTIPMLAQLYTLKQTKRIRKLLTAMHTYSLITILPFAIALILFPEVVIRATYGERFINAAGALRVLAIGTFFYSLTQVAFTYFYSSDRLRIPIYLLIGAAVINALGNYFVIPYHGIVGAAAVSAVTFTVVYVISLFYLRRTSGVEFSLHTWLRYAISGVVFTMSFLLIAHFVPTTFPWLVIVGVLSLIVYAATLFALKVISVQELRSLWHEVKNE